jgi:hypothetical protein
MTGLIDKEQIKQLLSPLYPAFKLGMLGFIIPGAISLILGVLILFSADLSGIEAGIMLLSTGGIALICLVGTLFQLLRRYNKVNNVNLVVTYGDSFFPVYLAYVLPEQNINLQRFLSNFFSPRELAQNLSRYSPVSFDSLGPVTFITFKKKGNVFIEKLGKVKKVFGWQSGNQIEIEYTPEDMRRMESLLKHELSHVMLRAASPTMTVDQQHEYIKEVE